MADHLSRLEDGVTPKEDQLIKETFPDEQLFGVSQATTPWYVDLVNYLVSGLFPLDLSYQQRRRFLHGIGFFYWDEPYLFKQCADQILRRCVPEKEMENILHHCHSSPYGGHYRGIRTAARVLQSGCYWPILFKYSHAYVMKNDRC